MWKYIASFIVILALALFIARQDERAAQESAKKATPSHEGDVSTEPHEDHSRENTGDTAGHTPSWYGFFRWPSGTTTWAILLTLLAIAEQTRETAKAAKATEEAVKTADKALGVQITTAKQQLRAYMAVKEAKVVLHKDGVLEASLNLNNCGQTPAYELRGSHNIGFSPYPIAIGFPTGDLRGSSSLIGAGNNFNIVTRLKELQGVPPDQIMAAFAVPDSVFVMAGYFTYRDIFKDKHFIKFQLILGGPCGPLLLETDDKGRMFTSLRNDSTGNEAD